MILQKKKYIIIIFFKIVSFIHSFFFPKLKIKDYIHAYIIYTKNHKRNRDSFIHAFT